MSGAKQAFERYRPLILVVLLLGSFVVVWWTGVTDGLDQEVIRAKVEAAGAFGVLLYWLLFAVGELMHVPGIVFVFAGVLAWGPLQAYPFALIGALGSVAASFFIVRVIGGKALTKIQKPWMQKIMAKLEQRPVFTVIVLRSILWLAPPLNYALALSSITFRDYLIGSALGLIVPVFGMVVGMRWLLSWFGA